MKDVAVIGGGIAGFATAARLQAQGLSTCVFEAHGQPGGCAGFYRRKGFAFDVGATTLVDFEPGAVGGELLEAIGMPPPPGEALPGYVAWLPDRAVTLYRDSAAWAEERLRALGDTLAHRRFWSLLDRLAAAFWNASRNGMKLPIQSPVDVLRAVRAIGLPSLPLARYASWTLSDALLACGLRQDKPLTALLSMLVEDTVHSSLDEAPLINAALGITIRGAGLTRYQGGMWGFWRRFLAHYRELGGQVYLGCPVESVSGVLGRFQIQTGRGVISAAQIVSALPAALTACLAPSPIARALQPYLHRDADAHGGALVTFLGVPEAEIGGQVFTHHQLFHDYARPVGNGNNMFVSVSAPGDTESAPSGYRAVMLSTHCELADWEGLTEADYSARKAEAGARLIALAQRIYPDLSHGALFKDIGTPRTYAHFTRRPRGAVGGVRQNLGNANQNAVPYSLGMPGFWLVGDSTWPGLGTVACVLGSRLVAEGVSRASCRLRWPSQHGGN